jgi:hypothetical protein
LPLLIRDYLENGPATSKEIQAYTGLSQSAVARKLREMGDGIIRLSSGRSVHYATTCNAFGGNDKLPLVAVDTHGNTVTIATIRPLSHGGFFVEPESDMPDVLLGARKNGLFDDLPYFLYDLGPQGFLGRKIAEEMSARFNNFPQDPRRWTTEHIGRYLVSNGEDLPGNLMFGEQALLRVRHRPGTAQESDYPDLADSVMRGVIPGSSAGGEQPKFTTFCSDQMAHVIVKFSPKGDTEIAQRWRDILITEYHAAKVIRCHNFQAAEIRLIEKGGRLFLESRRFDRTGEYGRMSMVSLQSIDSEFTGLIAGWPQVAGELANKKLISEAHAITMKSLWLFGFLINNTDMHLGNLSFAIEGSMFSLLPVYDMCSMGFAPKISGETVPYAFTPVMPKPASLKGLSIDAIKAMAHEFWEKVAHDTRISKEFRSFLDQGNPVDLL